MESQHSVGQSSVNAGKYRLTVLKVGFAEAALYLQSRLEHQTGGFISFSYFLSS